jgi:hypothetical protein
MKKVIYIILVIAALVLIGGVAYIFLNNRETVDIVEEVSVEYGTIENPEELSWVDYFPSIVPEYTDGRIKQISVVDPQFAQFEDEIAVVVEGTNYEEFSSYVEGLKTQGWIITYGEMIEPSPLSTIQLSFEEKSISASITSDGILRLSSYTRE